MLTFSAEGCQGNISLNHSYILQAHCSVDTAGGCCLVDTAWWTLLVDTASTTGQPQFP